VYRIAATALLAVGGIEIRVIVNADGSGLRFNAVGLPVGEAFRRIRLSFR